MKIFETFMVILMLISFIPLFIGMFSKGDEKTVFLMLPTAIIWAICLIYSIVWWCIK